jgi:thiol:disulfide interchange protein
MRTLRVILLIFFCSSIAGYAEKSDDKALKWNKWSKVGLDKALADGESVLVQFSAKWCLTCELNEKRCFQNEDVKSFLRSRKIVLLKADLTEQNNIAKKALKKWDVLMFRRMFPPQPPLSPIRSGPKTASKPSRQKQIPSSSISEFH